MSGELSVLSSQSKFSRISLLLPSKIRVSEPLSFDLNIATLMRKLQSRFQRVSVYISASVSNFSTLKTYFHQATQQSNVNLLPSTFELSSDESEAFFVWFDSISDLRLIDRLKALPVDSQT